MDFLFSDKDDDNFDSFITQHLKRNSTQPPHSNKKVSPLFQSIQPILIQNTNDTQINCIIQEDPSENIWKKMLNNLGYTKQIINWRNERKCLPYPLNQNYLSRIQEFKNQKIDAIICEMKIIEEFGDTTEIILQDQTGECKASILSELLSETNLAVPIQIYDNITEIQKKEQILLYLENVTVFSPNEFEISIVIGKNNIKFAIF